MLTFKAFHRANAAAALLGLTLLGGGPSLADQVIPDDLIVQGSLCTGFDCVNNEDFRFATIRLKENNTRIDFVDTSVGSFPTRDWRLEANSSASSGANYFAIKDMGNSSSGAEGGTAIFTATAGAPANSIFVDSSGRVGFRTSTPVLDLHARTGNTPGIRLEQDGGSGFTPQTWDIAGNEANFFVRDVTGGSRLPFRIRPGAPTSSIDISNDGFVGIGTPSPEDNLHIASSGNTSLRIETTGASAAQWSLMTVANSGLFLIMDRGTNNHPFVIRPGAPSRSLEILGNGTIRLAELPNCAGIQTDAQGDLSCAAGARAPAGGGTASNDAYAVAPVGSSSSGVRPGAYASLGAQPAAHHGTATNSESPPTDTAARNTCGAGDMAGTWSLIGTNIEKFGANSVLWCDAELTQAQRTPDISYSISGNCRSHVPNESIPQTFTIVGNGTITETTGCKLGGSFKIKQGNVVVTTANILEGRIEGPASRKTRAVAVSRWPRGRTSAIQTFVMQR